MNRKEKNILLLLLLCASLLVAMLYSPIGSPENYISSNSYGQHQGVTFSGKILNSPSSKSFAKNSSSGIFSGSSIATTASLPTASSLPNSSFATTSASLNNLATPATVGSFTKRTANYAVATSSESAVSSNASYAVQSGSTYSNEIKTSSGGFAGGQGVTFSGRTSRNSTNTNTQTGFTALNIDMTIFKDLNTSQGGGYTPGSGATDPGEDPIGNPIPVSDGYWFLLLMAVGYGYFKFFKKKGLLNQAN